MSSPLVAGDASIANRWLNGAATVMWIGDLISAALEPYLFQTLRVKPAGRLLPGSAYSAIGGSWVTIGNGGLGAAGLLTERNYSPFGAKEAVFTGSTVPTTGLAAPVNSRVISNADAQLAGSRTGKVFGGADWLAGHANLRLRSILYANAQSSAGMVRNYIRSASNAYKGFGNYLSLTAPPGAAYVADDVLFAAPGSGEDLAVESQSFEGATPPASSNVVLCGALVTNGDAGFTFVPANNGEWDVLKWIDTTAISDAALAGVLPLLGVTDFVIALGQNNPTSQTAAAFTSSLLQLVNRLRGVVPTASFTFLPTYDTDSSGSGTGHLVGFTDAHYAVQQQTARSCFLNLYAAAGSWSQLNAAGHLSDGIHPSAAGATYFLQTIQGLLDQMLAGSYGGAAVGRYASIGDVQDVFGVSNVAQWSAQDVNAKAADVSRVQRSLDYADAAIDDYFRGGPYAVPLALGVSAATVRRWAATLAGAWLFRAMSATSTSSASASLSLPAGAAFSASISSGSDPHAAVVADVYAEMAACKAGVMSLDGSPAAATLATAPAVAR